MPVGDSMGVLNPEYYPEGEEEDADSPKSYISRLARNSIYSIQQASQTADKIKEDLSQISPDDRSWMLSWWRKEFDRTNIEDSFMKYHRRLLHASFKQYLLMQIVICSLGIVIFLAINWDNVAIPVPDIVVQSVLLFVSILLYVIVMSESRANKIEKELPYFYQFVSVFKPLLLLSCDLGLQAYHRFGGSENTRHSVHVPWAFYIIITVYAFMPIRRDWVAMLYGGFISASYLVFSGMVMYPNDLNVLLQRLLSDFVYYLCINCLGFVSRFLDEITLRRSFSERRNCVESRFKLDYEKEQEEKLLLSIIPKHIAEDVSKDLRDAIKGPLAQYQPDDYSDSDSDDDDKKGNKKEIKQKGKDFTPYNQEYKDVSILFADIVNFTPLTTTLSVKDLVAMLNDLFGQFDAAAERNNCLRIKILGDCYYCVSGIPVFNQSHAIDSVRMGLDMIGVIAAVRAERKVNVDMRIGVHTGKVVSGLLGTRKWQFDIWSTDTTIANRMEQSGKPGRVHVTRQTLDCLRGTFEYETSDASETDSFLSKRKIETFLIIADPPSDEFIKTALSAPPSITLLASDVKTTIIIDGEFDETDEFDNRSSVSSESGIEDDRELSERVLKKLYRVFPVEYIPGEEPEWKDNSEVGQNQISPYNSTFPSKADSSETVSTQLSIDSNIVAVASAGKTGNLFEKRVNAGGGAVKKMAENRGNVVVPRRKSATNNTDPTAPQGRNRTASSTKSLTDYNDLRMKANDYMKDAPVSNFKKSGSQQFDLLTLLFTKKRWEVPYMEQTDPLFKYYHIFTVISMLCIMAIQMIMASYENVVFWGIFAFVFAAMLSIFPFSMASTLWMNFKDPKQEESCVLPPPGDSPIHFFWFHGRKIMEELAIRIPIFLFASVSILTLAIIGVIECPVVAHNIPIGDGLVSEEYPTVMCNYPWYFTFCCTLALATVNIFIRIHFIIKFILYSVAFAVYTSVILDLRVDVFKMVVPNDFAGGTPALSPEVAHVLYLATVVAVLHVMDRKEEFINRLDFVLKKLLRKETKLANETRIVNKILLQNILPEHVAKEYLSEGRSEDQLYHESHAGVAVMFASIPGFAEFWEMNAENDAFNGGLMALKTLNTIVSEFDQLLFEPQFACIEKIKVINSTYMAVCGVSTNTSAARNGAIMMNFAAEMTRKLDEINSDIQNELKLRIGIECGPIIAGVVGQQKPLYDIWGNTVNMASRMDYTGESGRIHVTEPTANMLMQEGVRCERRGITFVKGKGDIVTFWAYPRAYPSDAGYEPSLQTIEEYSDTEDL